MLARALIVLFSVLNLGVAAWWIAHDPPAPSAAVQVPAGVARLELVGERAAPPANAAAAVPAAANPPAETAHANEVPASPQCFSFGPFTGAAVATATSRLRPLVLTITPREQAPSGRGWRVYLPPLPSLEQAQAVASRANAAGFTDLLVVREGDEANSIALGRFSSEAAARKHADALNAAGFAARAEPLGGSATWLDVSAASGFDPAAAQAASGAAGHRGIDCRQAR